MDLLSRLRCCYDHEWNPFPRFEYTDLAFMTVHTKSRGLTADQEASVRRELDAILSGSSFTGSGRCSEFLEFVVTRSLAGDYELLNERFLGVELFGKSVDYETATDSVVRVRATDVRHRLARHYSEQQSTTGVTIGMASGTYIPEFNWSTSEPPPTDPVVFAGASRNRWMIGGIFGAALVIFGLSVACFTLWNQLRSVRQNLYPWKSSPSVAAFWAGFLDDTRGSDIVLGDSSYSLIQSLSKRQLSLSDYLSHDYTGQLHDLSADRLADLNQIATWSLGSAGEFELAQRFLSMDPLGKNIHLYLARKYMPDLIKHDNVVLVGSRFANPWDELFEGRMNFSLEFGNPYKITNRSPHPGEQQTYIWNGSVGYCIVAYLPNEESTGNVLLIEGTSSEATQAAGDFLLSEAQMSNFQKLLNAPKLPYFELLIKTSQVKGTPLTETIEAYRAYPNLH